jgi:hypothetical protein
MPQYSILPTADQATQYSTPDAAPDLIIFLSVVVVSEFSLCWQQRYTEITHDPLLLSFA